MIVAFYFRVGPTGGPFELVAVPPRRYAITAAGIVRPDRGEWVPADLDPCGIEHACNVCGIRTLEAVADLQGDDWLEQFSRLEVERQPIGRWWPHREVVALEDSHGPGAGAELVERVGQVELCPDCFKRHWGVDDWSEELLDRLYGPEDGPVRCYPDPETAA